MTERKRYRRLVLHPVQDGPKPRYCYVSADTLAEIDQIRSTYALQRRQIARGLLDPADIEQQLTAQEKRRLPVPLSALAARYLEREAISKRTRENLLRFLTIQGRPLARLDYRELTAPRLKDWIEGMIARKLSRGYVQLQWWILRSIITYAVEMGMIKACPWSIWTPKFKGLRRVKEGESARTVEELTIILHTARAMDEARGRNRGLLLEPRIACAALLGLHQGELAGLRWHDVDPVEGVVAIVRQYDDQPLKTAARMARMRALPELFETLFRHALDLDRMELFDPSGPVFPALGRSIPGTARPHKAGGRVIDERELRVIVTRAGLPNPQEWNTTALRRTFAMLEYEGAAGDLVAASQRTRHASAANFLKYLRRRTRGGAPPPGFSLRKPRAPELVGDVVAPAPPSGPRRLGEGG